MKQHIIVLLDVSYSMREHSQKMINGLNKFVASLRDHLNHCNIIISVILFCDSRTYLCKGVPVDEIKNFTINDLDKFGLTYLYDAIGSVITEWMSEKRAIHHLFIITDGVDNGSKEMTYESMRQYCETAVNQHGWIITHCDIDITRLKCDDKCVKNVHYDINNLEDLLGGLII